MRIKQTLTKQVNSFDFCFDILKKDYLEQILKLFELDKVYFCIYGVDKNFDFERLNKCKKERLEIIKHSNCEDIILEIDVDMISALLSILKDNLYEIVIWSIYLPWALFIDMLNDCDNFFTFYKKNMLSKDYFYLDFNSCEGNKVEIIYDISYNAFKYIAKEDLLKILMGDQ